MYSGALLKIRQLLTENQSAEVTETLNESEMIQEP